MSSSRIKTIVIAILLIVNIAFLALIVIGNMDTRKREAQVRENLVSVMADNGITLEKSTIPANVQLLEYKMGRNTENEMKAVSAVIGECTREDQGGNIFSYVSDSGEARFRGNGEFEITVTANAPEYSQSAAENLIKEMGIETGKAEITETDETVTALFLLELDKKRIFGCSVELCYEDGWLVSASGKIPTNEPEYRTDSSFMTVPTALMHFIENMASGGHVCSSIDSLESGYMMFVSVSGERILTPVWHISTDSGSYYINGVSGAMIS